MNFVTVEFAVFFFVVLIATRLLRGYPYPYKIFLLACNLFFYAYAGYVFIPLLLAVAVSNWGAARLMERAQSEGGRKVWLLLDILLNLSFLAFFKYYEFIITSLEALAVNCGWSGEFGLPIADLVFPVGISFYTFQGLSYAIDHYREKSPAQSLGRVLLFVSFFPTILAGPIMRAQQFLPQLDENRSEDASAVQEGFALILSGLFKKVVLASYLSEHVVRDVFLTPEAYSSWGVLMAVYGYTVQIFCDFSGYSDLAVGVGRLMGFRLPENFNAPYLALNLQDFWRRWHITLSLWLRDYLYIPLGGNRRGNRYLNLLITMVLGGLWHGAHFRFLVWGFGHGLGLCVVHAFHALQKKTTWKLPAAVHTVAVLLSWLLTFHFVALLWIFFRAEDMPRALEIVRRATSFGLPGDGFPVLAIPAVFMGLLLQKTGRPLLHHFVTFQERLPWPVQAAVLALLCSAILKLGPDGVLPFIYFQF